MRAADFARWNEIKYIWIDQECVYHTGRADKEYGIQSTHAVYRGAAVLLVLLGRLSRYIEDLVLLNE